jgi:hypothetical protein
MEPSASIRARMHLAERDPVLTKVDLHVLPRNCGQVPLDG